SFAGDSGTTVANKLGDTVAVKGDANITTTAGANGIQVGLNKDLKVDSVKAGDTVVNNNGVNVGDKVALGKDGLKAGDVNITAEGINAGGKKVTGVAAGTVAAGSTDAVNGSQLYQANQAINQSVTNIGNYVVNMGNQINQRIDNVESDSKAGTAAAMAVAGLPQAYLPGKSMMAVAGGVYRGESGYAVGFSSISDGGNWIIKGTATGNSRGHYGATAGVGYQW
ncbi:YadA family autotransporter adhesin, partial [Neisseria sicca]